MNRVVITGLGVVAPNAIGSLAFGAALKNGISGVKAISFFDSSHTKSKVAGEVRDFNPSDYFSSNVVRRTDRFVHLGLLAAKQALQDAGLLENYELLKSTGIIVGSGQGGLSFHEQNIIDFVVSNGSKKPSANSVPKITSNAVTAHIAMQFNIKGLNQVISTACSSGAQAIGSAFRLIQHGVIDSVLTGGVEAPLSPVMFDMYSAMTALSTRSNDCPDLASKPFDVNRDGFVLSEGAAFLMLESLPIAKKRSATIYGEVVGFGSNCGAYHMATPDPSGKDAACAMNLAIEDAKMTPDDIDYINAHGTATKYNDLAETTAVKHVFSNSKKKVPPISSIKSMIGHTIGAAGAIEAVACCIALKEGFIPPTINLNNPDPECDLDYVPNVARAENIHIVMSNSFGFGSNNAVLIFKNYD